jgi:Rod binding domain-containing protein
VLNSENSSYFEERKMNNIPPLQVDRVSIPKENRNEALWASAQSLEANFLAVMLKSSGVGAARSEFGGGVGEDQFSSFLVQEYAAAIVQKSGIGLAESLYHSLANLRNEDAK